MWLAKRNVQTRSYPIACVAQTLIGVAVSIVVMTGCLMVSSYIDRMTLEAATQIVSVFSADSVARVDALLSGALDASAAVYSRRGDLCDVTAPDCFRRTATAIGRTIVSPTLMAPSLQSAKSAGDEANRSAASAATIPSTDSSSPNYFYSCIQRVQACYIDPAAAFVTSDGALQGSTVLATAGPASLGSSFVPVSRETLRVQSLSFLTQQYTHTTETFSTLDALWDATPTSIRAESASLGLPGVSWPDCAVPAIVGRGAMTLSNGSAAVRRVRAALPSAVEAVLALAQSAASGDVTLSAHVLATSAMAAAAAAAQSTGRLSTQVVVTLNVSDLIWTRRRTTLYDVVEIVVNNQLGDVVVASSQPAYQGRQLGEVVGAYAASYAQQRATLPSTTSLDLVVLVSIAQLQSQAAYPTRLVILVVVGIGVFVAISSALAVHVLTRSLVHLARDMVVLGRLDFDRFDQSLHVSFVAEIQYVAAGFQRLLQLAEAVKTQLPHPDDGSGHDEDGVEGYRSHDETATNLGAGEDDEEQQRRVDQEHSLAITWERTRTVTIALSYEDAVTSEFINDARFQFLFGDVEPKLFERLMAECKAAVSEDFFEPASLEIVDSHGSHVLLRHSMQLQECLSTSPSSISLVMLRTSQRSKGAFAAAALDMLNAIVTVVFSVNVVRQQDTSTSVPFVTFFFTALVLNMAICIGLIRSNRADHFDQWLERSSVQVAIAVACCAPNTMNLAILWSNVQIGRLRFHAPFSEKNKRQSISLSVFGFLFSDVAQLLYKIWIVYSSAVRSELNILALSTAGVSVAFNLLFKIHAMLLSTGSATGLGASGGSGMDLKPSASDSDGTLLVKEVSFVRCRFALPAYILQLQLRTIEYNNMYSAAVATARRFQGVPVLMHGGDMVFAFNAHRRAPQHALDAIACANELAKHCMAEQRPVGCVVATVSCLTGLLGTMSQKALHCFGPVDSLSRMCDVALASEGRVLVLGNTLRHLECDGLANPIKVVCPSEFLAAPSVRTHVTTVQTLFAKALSVADEQLAEQEGVPVDPREHEWMDEQLCGVVHDNPQHVPEHSIRYAQFAEGAGVAYEPRDVVMDRARRIAALIERAREYAAVGGLVDDVEMGSRETQPTLTASKIIVL